MQQFHAPLADNGGERSANTKTRLHEHHPRSRVLLEERSRHRVGTNLEKTQTRSNEENTGACPKEGTRELERNTTKNVGEIGNDVQRLAAPLLQNQG
mgnify:FL=1